MPSRLANPPPKIPPELIAAMQAPREKPFWVFCLGIILLLLAILAAIAAVGVGIWWVFHRIFQ